MNLSYGHTRTGELASGDDGWVFDTDLGIQTDFEKSTSISPAMGRVKTVDASIGGTNDGYTIGVNRILTQSTSTGTGSGAVFRANVGEGIGAGKGGAKPGFELQPIANFALKQSTLQLNLNVDDSQYTNVRITATGEPRTVTTVAGMGTAVKGPSAGTGLTVNLTATDGQITKVVVLAGGSLYKVGEKITVTTSVQENAFSAASTPSVATLVLLPIEIILTEASMEGEVKSVEILQNGVGYAVGEDIVLIDDEGRGGASVEVASLSGADIVNTAPNNQHPRAIMIGELGITAANAQSIAFEYPNGSSVILGGFVTGKIVPVSFSKVLQTGSTITLGTTTIFY